MDSIRIYFCLINLSGNILYIWVYDKNELKQNLLMKIISTPNLPKSNGHYAQVIEHNGILYMSGETIFLKLHDNYRMQIASPSAFKHA